MPAISCILQNQLRLSNECYILDISLGCSEEDNSTYPLFGDAGTAMAIEYDSNANGFKFSLNSYGNGYEAIIIKDGGYRNPVTMDSFNNEHLGEGIEANKLNLKLDGMSVFSFGISKASKSVNSLIEKFGLDKESLDYFIFHQANMFMNEKILKKLKLVPEQTSYCMKDYGSTSCSSIPLTMVTQMKNDLETEALKNVGCGFGIGLSWGSAYFETENIKVSDLIEL